MNGGIPLHTKKVSPPRSEAQNSLRNLRILFAIYLAIFLLILIWSILQVAGAVQGGTPPWYVWPLGLVGAAVSLDGMARGGNWVRFIGAHAALVLLAALTSLAQRPADPLEALLPVAVLILIPLLFAQRLMGSSPPPPRDPKA